MTVGDDDYGDAFKKARLEHDERRQGDIEAKRLQAEADADIAVLSDVLLPQLQTAAQKLGPLGGRIDIRQYGRTGKMLRPASVGFRITDQQDHQDQPGHEKGHQSGAAAITLATAATMVHRRIISNRFVSSSCAAASSASCS
jgi:hypothetical protein